MITVPYIKSREFGTEVPQEAVKADIACNNWPGQFPYSPSAKAFLWHNGDRLFIEYVVDEEYIAALACEDQDHVYRDSCAEFFIAFDNNGYYNIESNCNGTILMSHRRAKKVDIEYASPDVLHSIVRQPSLGNGKIECHAAEGPWRLRLSIPATAFFKHDLAGFAGLKARCNLFKCGDALPKPHFLSAFPIEAEAPDFHRPEFFREIVFDA